MEYRMIEQEILDDLNESISKFEKKLNIPNGFYNNLYNEDDWSFVIKLSAFLETASTDVLTTVLGYRNIENAISYLDYGNSKSGKVVIMQKLEIITKNQATTLRKFLEIRNKVAHRLEDINFTFQNYIASLKDEKQKKEFVLNFGHSVSESFELKKQKIEKKDFVLENPKLIIWFAMREIIGCMHLSKEEKEIKDKLTFTLTPDVVSKYIKNYK